MKDMPTEELKDAARKLVQEREAQLPDTFNGPVPGFEALLHKMIVEPDGAVRRRALGLEHGAWRWLSMLSILPRECY